MMLGCTTALTRFVKAAAAALLLAAIISPAVLAQQTAPAAPDAAIPQILGAADDLLGERFESPAAGIALRVPAGMQRTATSGDQMVQYIHPQRGWSFSVGVLPVVRPMPLTSERAKSGDDEAVEQAPAAARVGAIELVVEGLLRADRGADVLQQEKVACPAGEAGLIVARTSVGIQRALIQTLVLRADDRRYFAIKLQSPAARGVGADAAAPADEIERQATSAMAAVIQSAELLDTLQMAEDQGERLLRTMGLLVAITPETLEQAIVGEQWLRIQRAGKDSGYALVRQRHEDRADQKGLLILVRGWMDAPTAGAAPLVDPLPPAPVDMPAQSSGQTAWETSLWVSLDRRSELWSTQVQLSDGLDTTLLTEIGQTEREARYVRDPAGAMGELGDPGNPAMKPELIYELRVKHVGGRGGDQSVERSVPPFYLPAALGQMLPRLVARSKPGESYMFASYSGVRRELMTRYVDVGAEQDVRLGGGPPRRAIPVRDRLGFEGPVTTHYLTAQGEYLGSENRAAGLIVLPADLASVVAVWPQAAELVLPQERGE